MLKSIQIKVVLIFLILGILTTTLIGIVLFNSINLFENNLLEIISNESEIATIKDIINLKKEEIIYMFLVFMGVFVIGGLLLTQSRKL